MAKKTKKTQSKQEKPSDLGNKTARRKNKATPPKKCTVNGVTYDSIKAASLATGKSRTAISKILKGVVGI